MLREIGYKKDIENLLEGYTQQPNNEWVIGIIEIFSGPFDPNQESPSWENRIEQAEKLIEEYMEALPNRTVQNNIGASPLGNDISKLGYSETVAGQATAMLATSSGARLAGALNGITANMQSSDFAWLTEEESYIYQPAVDPLSRKPTPAVKPQIQLQLSNTLDRPYVPMLGANFCVPNNPVPYSMFLYVQLNLFKIRNCRNIAGMKRTLDPYAAPTDATSG